MQDKKNYQLFVEKLCSILTTVNEWLQYAESKNVTLMTFTGVTITIIVTYISTIEKIFMPLKIGLSLSLFLLFLSSLVSLISFLPYTDTKNKLYKIFGQAQDVPDLSDILIHFFYLRKYLSIDKIEPSSEKLIIAITNAYFPDSENESFVSKETKDLCHQIITNSNITFQKFELANISIKISLIGILIIPFSMLISLIINRSL
jgi:hypothetical protein